jgi:hypothetical protein
MTKLARNVHFQLLIVAVASTAIGHSVRAAGAPGVIAPGKWAITVQTTEPLEGPPTTTEVCIEPEAIAKIAPPVSRPTDECQASPGSFANGVLSFIVTCPHLGRTVSTTITYRGNTFGGTVEIQTTGGSTFKQTIEAHRLGACDPQQ